MLCLLASKPKASEVMSKYPNTILHCPSLEYQTIISKLPLFVMNIAATGYVAASIM